MSERPENEILDWNAPQAAQPQQAVYTGERVDVILPAGGTLDDHFARVALTPYKALMKAGGPALILQAMIALQESGRVGKIVLVAPEEVALAAGERVDIVVKDTGSLAMNVKFGLQELVNDGLSSSRVLILTTDLPYITGKMINDFLDLCPKTVDFCVPVISDEEYLDRFPGSSSTFAKLADGNYTIGCAYYVEPHAFLKAMPKIEQVIANRKSVPNLAKLIGFKFLWDYLFKKVTVADVVAKIQEITGCTGLAVRKAPPELAFDVDDIPDYEYALRNK